MNGDLCFSSDEQTTLLTHALTEMDLGFLSKRLMAARHEREGAQRKKIGSEAEKIGKTMIIRMNTRKAPMLNTKSRPFDFSLVSAVMMKCATEPFLPDLAKERETETETGRQRERERERERDRDRQRQRHR